VKVALRTQQIIAYETGVALTADPLAGSYLVEILTTRMERAILAKLTEVDDHGGAVAALESGFISSEIDEESFRQQQMIEDGSQVVVGVNRFRGDGVEAVRHRLSVDPDVEAEQVTRLRALRERRNADAVAGALLKLRSDAEAGCNIVPTVIEALRARATVGDIVGALKTVWGQHRP
jgi:methylmalonyl-CoA mutase N-terminal domain/subunit